MIIDPRGHGYEVKCPCGFFVIVPTRRAARATREAHRCE